jgi:NADH-quinone oxidoreductase subunit J
MDLGHLAFYFFALMTVVSGALVVFLRNIVYAAFSLLLTFIGVAGLYVFMGADFLAATQILLYVGGILVLIIFGVMLTRKVMDVEIKVTTVNFFKGLVLSAIFLVILISVVLKTEWMSSEMPFSKPTTQTIGTLFMTDYLLPFEVASVLLLGALIGAALLARKGE